ncbi:MAG: RluA family pseudouridine synthase [Spirochaetaceae bacterium]|nr:RluA family pseudouridine synthase [Spirochaetaceae bacterium]
MHDYDGIVDLPPSQSKRLDLYIAEDLRLMRRSRIRARRLGATVNGKTAKLSRLVKAGDALRLVWEDDPPIDVIPEHIPLDIVYEDGSVIVVNKPQGLVVHPGAGNVSGTLANALLWRFNMKHGGKTDAPFAGEGRPFIVHRLDKDTSGVMIAAWDSAALSFLSDQFRERAVRKTYAAIVNGCPAEPRGTISTNIVRDRNNRQRFTVSERSGKSALTRYKVVRSAGGCSLLKIRPKTGRTHQIRVHLRSIGHPIVGDPLYGQPPRNGLLEPALALHSKTLEIVLPDRATRSRFTTPLPARFKKILLQGISGNQ